MDTTILSDKELYDALDMAGDAEKFLSSTQGQLFKEAADRISWRIMREFALGDILPKDTSGPEMIGFLTRIIDMRNKIRKYKYGFLDEIKELAQEEEALFYEVKQREIETRKQSSSESS